MYFLIINMFFKICLNFPGELENMSNLLNMSNLIDHPMFVIQTTHAGKRDVKTNFAVRCF